MVRLPADEGQLRSMLAQGLLDEGHALELKRALPPGTAANKELARDLGQFTIDGGVHIIVDEGDETAPPSLTPVDLAGLAERIEEVAANRVDPPLHVRIQTIPAAGQPGKGYLLVIVPPTPTRSTWSTAGTGPGARRPATPCPTPRSSATTSSC
jgi:hypothetical protein